MILCVSMDAVLGALCTGRMAFLGRLDVFVLQRQVDRGLLVPVNDGGDETLATELDRESNSNEFFPHIRVFHERTSGFTTG